MRVNLWRCALVATVLLWPVLPMWGAAVPARDKPARLTPSGTGGEHAPAGVSRRKAPGLAAKYPALAGKLDRHLLEAWDKVCAGDPQGALKRLASLRGVLAENKQEVVVVVSLEEGVTPKALESLLKAQGASPLRSGSDHIKVTVPVERLGALATLPGVVRIRTVKPPHPKNVTMTEGLAATLANAWHAAGHLGQGAKVAVIDTSFGGLAARKTQDEIPASAVEVNYTGSSMESDPDGHGSACAEIIYDLAPAAQMVLIKIDDVTDLIAAKDYCLANGVKIVSCSLGWDALNFHDGMAYVNWFTTVDNHPVTAVNAAVAGGVFWVNSAGNEQYRHTLIGWRDGGTADDCLDWDSSYGNLNVLWMNGSTTIPAGTEIDIYLTWNQWPVTSHDFDLELYMDTGSGWTYLDSSDDTQNGSATSYPYEEIYRTVPATARYAVLVYKVGATVSPTFILRYYGVDEPDFYGYNNITSPAPGSIGIPADAASAFTVGAVEVGNYTNGPIEWFSSLGPNNRAYTGGSAVIKPDLCGPDQISTVTYGATDFAGTSAAAPHVAGLAALAKGLYPALTPTQLKTLLETNGFNLGVAGKDNTYGAGAARAPVHQHTLVITTPHGKGIPPAGTNWVNCSASVTAAITNSPVDDGLTQYVCRGWAGTGNVPASGTTTNTGTFTLSTNSSVAWLWRTNYWLHIDRQGSGTVSTNDVWLVAGTNVTVTATAAVYFVFGGWQGQTNGCTITSNRITVLMNGPRDLTAVFSALLATNNVPQWWLAQYGLTNFNADAIQDRDGDGMPTWAEWVAGCDPTNAKSIFQFVNALPSASQGRVVSWLSASNRYYTLLFANDLMGGTNAFVVLPGASNMPATPAVNSYTDTVQGVGPYFYRIDVHE